jgi:hypothetical protein
MDNEMGKLMARIYNLLLVTGCDCCKDRVVISLSRLYSGEYQSLIPSIEWREAFSDTRKLYSHLKVCAI